MTPDPIFPTPAAGERLGLPSASKYEQIILCRGALSLERVSPKPEEEPTNEAAEAGTRVHAIIAARETLPEDADPDELANANICIRKLTETLDWWKTSVLPPGAPEPTGYREERLFLHEKLTPIFSGQPDEIFISNDFALVVDYKTGWLAGNTTSSEQNPQLRALAVLVAENFDIKHVSVCIITPRGSGPVSVAQYPNKLLNQANKELRAVLKEATSTPAGEKLTAGEKQCRYCKALANCPAAAKPLVQIAEITIGNGDERRELVDNKTLAELLDKCGQAEKMIGAIRAEAKRRLEEGATVPGWKLEAGTDRRSVADAAGAFAKLNTIIPPLTPEIFANCCTVKLSFLEKAVRRYGKIKDKDMKDFLAGAIGAYMTTKTTNPSLERE